MKQALSAGAEARELIKKSGLTPCSPSLEEILQVQLRGEQAAKKRLEGMLINAQKYASQNPFVSCSFSYSVARSFANAGDTPGYVLTIEGPWSSGLDFEFVRKLYDLRGGVFDYLNEFGLPQMLNMPLALVKVEEVGPLTAPKSVFP